MAKHQNDGRGHVSKGIRTSSNSTGALPFHVDTKQLKLIKPLVWMVSGYSEAERKREHLLLTRGTHQIQITKMPNGTVIRRRIPIQTSHEMALS